MYNQIKDIRLAFCAVYIIRKCPVRTEQEFFNERNCFQHDTEPENLACHRLSLVISFVHVQSNKGHSAGFLCCLHRSQAPCRTDYAIF